VFFKNMAFFYYIVIIPIMSADSPPIRILIADDHEVVRRGLSLMLRQEPDFEVVGEARDGQEAVELTAVLSPTVVLLDWKMPRMDGLQAARAIKTAHPSIRTLMLSGAVIETAVLDSLDDGVDGHIHKDSSPSDLAHAIRIVAGGRPHLGPEITQALIAHSRRLTAEQGNPTTLVSLSDRETEVLKLMATPATYRQIGEQLFISEETVRTYVKRIMKKLEQPNRTQAVIAGLRAGIIQL
jgi:DNA-binding NarL/FixJ family response regulator